MRSARAGNDFGDDGLSALAHSVPPTLEVLGLAANHKITDLGAATLADNIDYMPRLRQLDLSSTVRRPRLACPNDAPRTREAVEMFVEFYLASPSARLRLVEEARQEARENLQMELEDRCIAPTITVDGVVCRRRLYCHSGARMQEAWRDALRGVWTLARDDPLCDGAPHYERVDEDGDTSHLFRCQSMRGSRVWYVGPTPTVEGGVAAAWDEALHPQLIDTVAHPWDVTTETTWVPDSAFHFSESIPEEADAAAGAAMLEGDDGKPEEVEAGAAAPSATDEAAVGSMRSELTKTRSRKPLPECSQRPPVLDTPAARAARRRMMSANWRAQFDAGTTTVAATAVTTAVRVSVRGVSAAAQAANKVGGRMRGLLMRVSSRKEWRLGWTGTTGRVEEIR